VQTIGLYCHVTYTLRLHDFVGGQVQRLFHSAFWSMNKNSITHTCQAAYRITVQYHLFLICPDGLCNNALAAWFISPPNPTQIGLFVSFLPSCRLPLSRPIIQFICSWQVTGGYNKKKGEALDVIWVQTAKRTDSYSVILQRSCRTNYSGYVVSYGNGRIMNDELERMWQEATITYSELIYQICYRIKIKTTKCQSQQPVLVQHSKWILCDRKWDELPLRQRHWSCCP
jgi:hypothetical protein